MYYCGVGSKLKVLYRKLRAKQKAERLENNNEASAAKGARLVSIVLRGESRRYLK